MKTLIAIPSKNRVEIFKKYAYRWLMELPDDFDWVVFVEPQDYENYQSFLSNAVLHKMLENDKGLGYAKKQIRDYARANGYELVLKLDDDNNGWTDYRQKTDHAESAAMYAKFMKLFEQEVWVHDEVKAIAFPYDFHMFEPFKFRPVKKVQSTYLVRTEFLTPEDDYRVFEDFSVGLNILTKGGKLLKYGLSGQQVGVAVGKGVGGCNAFDRAAEALKSAVLLRKMYPPLTFRRVDKPWKIEPDMRSIKL